MLSRALMMTSLETLKISFALYIKLFGESVSIDIGTEGSVAVSRYDQAHREWLKANEDEHMRAIRIQAQENVRLLKASVEAKRVNGVTQKRIDQYLIKH